MVLSLAPFLKEREIQIRKIFFNCVSELNSEKIYKVPTFFIALFFPFLEYCACSRESKLLYIYLKNQIYFRQKFDVMLFFFTFGCVTGWVYNFIFPQSSPVAHNFPLFDLATVLKSVPSIVSGQIPMVLKLKRQV